MRSLINIVLAAASIFFLFGCTGSPPIKGEHAYFETHIPSYQEEVRFLWSVIRRIEFYRENGYQLLLPINDSFDVYLKKAENGELSNSDFDGFAMMFKNEIYNPMSYKAGYEKVQACLERANQAIPVFDPYRRKWGFHVPSQYLVQLTLYGPGGSYDPKTGKIILLTTVDGIFKRGIDPLDTIIHEAVHIGIESKIVKRYGLSHWTKERIVDRFVLHHFQDMLPNYKMQTIPNVSIDTIFADPTVWNTLPKSIESFVLAQERALNDCKH
jgi:hypothetical protein